MPRVPMRVLYWGRWADSAGGVGPFSATCAAWIEGGTHGYLPGGFALRFDKPQPKLIEPEPALPANREEKYSVAVLEVHYQSFQTHPAPAPALEHDQHEPRQLEGPVEESQAA